MTGRLVVLVLVRPDGTLVGQLPPMPVDSPWWPEAEPIVRAAKERHGLDVTVLRMLEADRPVPHGGTVTYLAEVTAAVPGAHPWDGRLDDHPLRMPWARPGGPAADVAWADAALAARGRKRIGPAEQIRTWNLSSLWRLPVDGGWVWLKHVPPFFGHEAAIIRLLGVPWTPSVIAADGPRSLLEEIPGDDLYDAGFDELSRAVSLLVGLQRDWAGRVDELLGIGLPDWRAGPLTTAIADTVARTAHELTSDDRRVLDEFVTGLPARTRRVGDCGIPDTLVHGDFAGGNLRGDGRSLVLLDWGDSAVGHPLLDQPAMLDRSPPDAIDPLRDHWADAWSAAIPGCDPRGAARLLAPVAAARQAVIYRGFLDRIEPAEHPYHRADPVIWLRRTADSMRGEGGDGA